jgi:hypothetical protein
VVAVLSKPGTLAPEPRLHLRLAAGPRHALAPLLAGESPDRVAASDVLGADDDRRDCQGDDERARQRRCRQNGVEHAAKDV